MTNGDHIRAMTDEELAKKLSIRFTNPMENLRPIAVT